jgi:hypothetical protein
MVCNTPHEEQTYQSVMRTKLTLHLVRSSYQPLSTLEGELSRFFICIYYRSRHVGGCPLLMLFLVNNDIV